MIKSGIYIIKNLINNKLYVGSAININNIWDKHISDLKLNKHHSIKLQRAWNKYGSINFKFDVLEFCIDEKLLIQEQYWIDNLEVYKNGYNCRPKANSNFGLNFTEEHKIKIGNSNRGKKRTEISREKMSNSKKGTTLSEEHKKKISDSMKKHKKSVEHKENLSRSLKGKIVSEETKIKMSNSRMGKSPWNKK